MKSTIILHLEPHCEKYVRYYFQNEHNQNCKFSRELKNLILICCEPHANGIVKCPEGLNEVVVDCPIRPEITKERYDMRAALHIPGKKMKLLNDFINHMIEREINTQVDIYSEMGLNTQDAIYAVLIRYSFEENEYSFDRAKKMNHRARRGYGSA